MKMPKQRRAFALVLVLIALVISSSMAVFFLTSVARERLGVNLYATGAEVHHLAGMPVSLVIGQINAATKEGTLSAPVSWVSQPGMIRTYDADGNLKNAHKLYSWDNSVESGAGFDPAATAQVPPSDWKDNPATYTDLNQQVNGIYPIVDPRAEKGQDPDNAASPGVEGFSIDRGNSAVSASGFPAPMPVKWLYVLEDGQMVAPTGASGSTVTVAGATKDNPVIGRVAYWTDDETCKVNLNTASEGAFWDWPKAASRDEMQFAGNPPAKGEFNRIPGHPSMTSFSAVFPGLLTGDRWSGMNASTSYQGEMQKLLNLSPRTGWGGSMGGTYPIIKFDQAYAPQTSANAVPVAAKVDRLYVSPDELLFSTAYSSSRVPYTQMSPEELSRRNFFLTSTSRSPETTLFETPRISLWPITWPYKSAYFQVRTGAPASNGDPTAPITSNPWMTAEDKLLAFCATLNKTGVESRYYVQRQNPDSPTYDWESIARNKALFKDYIRNLTSKKIPGFGGSFEDRYGGSPAGYGRDAISTKIFDHIRSNVNQISTGATPSYSYTGATLNVSSADKLEPQAFSVVPIRTDMNTRGLGCFPKLNEVAIVFFATKRNVPKFVGSDKNTKNDPRNWINLIDVAGGNVQTTEMQAAVLLDFSPGMGANIVQTPTFWIKVTQGGFSAAGSTVNLANRIVQWSYFVGTTAAIPSFAGLFRSKDHALTFSVADHLKAKTFNPTPNSVDNWSLISDPIPVSGPTFSFSSSNKLVIEMYGVKSANHRDMTAVDDASLKIATYEVDFKDWNGNHATPLAPRWTSWNYPAYTTPPNPPVIPAANFMIPDPAFKVAPADPYNYQWVGSEIAPCIHGDVTLTTTRRRAYNLRSGYMASYLYGDYTVDASGFPTSTGDAGSTSGYSTNFENRVSGGDQSASADRDYKVTDNSSGSLVTPYKQGSNYAIYPWGHSLITAYDTVISMVASDKAAAGGGDPRVIEKAEFIKVRDAFPSGTEPREVIQRLADATPNPYGEPISPRNNRQYHTLGSFKASGQSTGLVTDRSVINVTMADAAADLSGTGPYYGIAGIRKDWSSKIKPITTTTGLAATATLGDWSSNPGVEQDGGIQVRPDQVYQGFYTDPNAPGRMQTPYFPEEQVSDAQTASFFSPNRQVPSPVILGSLPRSTTTGWETLAFSPNTAKPSHPGRAISSNTAPDHLWLDLFWMPVAEPYPVSDQFSTAGKVNLNYKMMPFGYINRKTALHAAFKSTWITAMPSSIAADYKSPYFMMTNFPNVRTRYKISIDETLKAFDRKFDVDKDLFRSASQICEMFLYPSNPTTGAPVANYDAGDSAITSWWSNQTLTSDTAREAPYDHLYSRVTTKSNTFTVHWRVQSLRKAPDSAPGTWDESRDRKVSELRGSTLIERYIDPNATDIPDYADSTVISNASTQTLTHYYKWRVVSENYFQP